MLLKEEKTDVLFQPIEEKNAERRLAIDFFNVIALPDSIITKLQKNKDDGKTDAIFFHRGKHVYIEIRQKGFPNHSGKDCPMPDGWDTWFLVKDGIFINESTIRNHKDTGFVFIVEIKGSKPRAAFINKSKIKELLKQPRKLQRSTNTRKKQSVKSVPLKWFKKY